MLQPGWYEHSLFGREVDVAALPLGPELPARYELRPINAIDFDAQFHEEVADDAFVVGYPFSAQTDAQFPIWKRASIASEPGIDVGRLPKMWVDTATRPGLSGSPVIMQRVATHMVNGVLGGDTTLGRIRNFIGVYSGRIGAEDELKAQLGVVWKARLIQEIVDAKAFGRANN